MQTKITDPRFPNKLPVEFDLTSVDGNAFMLMGTFSKKAKRVGWMQEEIDQVLDVCKSGNYDNLVATLLAVTTDSDKFNSEVD